MPAVITPADSAAGSGKSVGAADRDETRGCSPGRGPMGIMMHMGIMAQKGIKTACLS
jgi:hypothetical protein